jgi:hypothetical protein
LCTRTNGPESWRTTIKSAEEGEYRSSAELLLPFIFSGAEKMDKRKALSIIFHCATAYRNNLEGKNVLFAFGGGGKCSFFETAFPSYNFQHLTGVDSDLTASQFYNAGIDRRLTLEQFSFSRNGTTPLKLEVLQHLMEIYKNARMVGDYNNERAYLYTEKIVGGVTANLGFVKDANYPESGFYVPNTTIKDDIRNLSLQPVRRVLAILVKKASDPKYPLFTYLAKGISLDTPHLQEILREKAVPHDSLEYLFTPRQTE